MAAQVVRCSACGMRYNGAEYSQCPYCTQGGGEKKGLSWGRKKPKAEDNEEKRATAAEAAAPAETEKPAAPADDTPKPEVRQGLGTRTQSFYAISVADTPVNTGTGGGESPKEEPEARQTAPQAVPVHGPAAGAAPVPSPAPVPAPVPAPAAVPTEPAAAAPSMAGSIQKLGKTTAKYIGADNGGGTAPAVGWLVCVKGVYFGQAFALKSGMNKIGRSPEMDVALLRDDSVSRNVVMKIAYDSRANEFNALPGESGEICYVSGKAMYERVQLKGYEEVEFGDTGLNKFVFVPLCGEHFRWETYTAKN